MASGSPLSYSGFRAYTECPLRWKYLYIDHLPELPRGYFSFGRSIHSALEEFLSPLTTGKAAVPGGPGSPQRTLLEFDTSSEGAGAPPRSSVMGIDALLEVYRRVWVSEGYLSPEDERRNFDLGCDLLRRFHAVTLADPPRPLAVEEKLQARLDGIAIHGIVDRIDEMPQGKLEVLDYKTSKELSLREARESDQLTLYQVLVEQNYHRDVEALTLYHVRTLSPLRTPARGKEVVGDLTSRLGEAADGIREEVYDARPGPYCRRCDFRDRCPEWREVPPAERDRVQALVERYVELQRQGEGLREEMEGVASELHAASDRLGVHRLPGRKATVYRRRQLAWEFPPEQVLPILRDAGLLPRVSHVEEERVARLLHDPDVAPEVRNELQQRARRRTSWGLKLEGS